MTSYSSPTTPAAFGSLGQSFAQNQGLPFADVLSPATVAQAAGRHQANFGTGHTWTVSLTLWTFLTQCLSGAKDCVSAVARAIAWCCQHGQTPPTPHTGSYCKARAKLPLPLLQDLTRHSGQQLEQHTPSSWRWRDRRVLLVDGTTLSLPDTAANQQAWPQSTQQKPGLGFPMMRVVVLLTFASAAWLDAVEGPCQGEGTSEQACFRQLLPALRPNDIVVADRHYCAYWLVAWLVERQVDVAVRLHGRRHIPEGRRHRLGKNDWLIRWERPPRYDWMDAATWQQLPEFLLLRLVQVRLEQPGYRTRRRRVVTTLGGTDVSTADVAALYHWRWHVELDLRHLKSTLQLARWRCQKPELARKELWTHLLGYNLIRPVLAQAAQHHGYTPRQLSFAGALHSWQELRVLRKRRAERNRVPRPRFRSKKGRRRKWISAPRPRERSSPSNRQSRKKLLENNFRHGSAIRVTPPSPTPPRPN
jgi:hypothetical protein